MDERRLETWAELLLDPGRRNNLINYRDTKASAVDVIAPDIVKVIDRAENPTTFEVYDPKLEDEEEFELSDANSQDNLISKDNFYAAYAGKLKKNGQILIYNRANTPIQALKNIRKKARAAIEETGVNIAYMAFGFINWREREGAPSMQAPILLVPVSIEYESAVKPISVRVIDGDVIVNPTFSYKLANEYGITLPEYDEARPANEYFDDIRAIVAPLKWTVTEECRIGIFSFLKINMYRDLKDNAAVIVNNPSVKTLLGEPPAPRDVGEEIEDGELHNVVDADSSQTKAIKMALSGESFVLQGPPGTGKSQTITNIIAECMLAGKKVLFVSEKLAALSVVYEKLKRAGLQEFCLELHSHKANKKQVIDELCHTLSLSRTAVSDRARRELENKERARQKLDEYASALRFVHPELNMSLYEIFDEIAANRATPEIEFRVKDVATRDYKYASEVEEYLWQYAKLVPSVGRNYRKNFWYGFENTDSSFDAMEQVKRCAGKVKDACNLLKPLLQEISLKYGIAVPNWAYAILYRRFFKLLYDSKYITSAQLSKSEAAAAIGEVARLQEKSEELKEQRAVLFSQYDVSVLNLNGAEMYTELVQFGNPLSRLFNGAYKSLLNTIKYSRKIVGKTNYNDALTFARDLRTHQQAVADFAVLDASAKKVFGSAYKGESTDFEAMKKDLNVLAKLLDAGVKPGNMNKVDADDYDDFRKGLYEAVRVLSLAVTGAYEAADELSHMFNPDVFNLKAAKFDVLEKKCEDCLANLNKLENWCRLASLLKKLTKCDMLPFVLEAIDKNLDPDVLASLFKRVFYSQWADYVIRSTPALAELPRMDHDTAVEIFKRTDCLNFEINMARIKSSLSMTRPDLGMVTMGSAVAILRHEGEKTRKKKSIRQLMSSIGDLVQTLKPCFLMSPLSVSTFLGPEMTFDVVVFDEASQIFPQDAIGAIYRGKQLIVVGDSKQMPPSNFFTASTSESEDDDETESIRDFESILDLCASAFPQCCLKWHYRSRCEPLIAFSNKNYYNNSLVTFPSAQREQFGRGVEYCYVSGIFDRETKTNRKEAERVVELVFECIRTFPNRSLGVVAFSISQQALIEHLIYRRRRLEPELDPFFKSDKVEPFFVKNLETVQGDERDTIIFSVAYAHDSRGSLYMNFGPLNRVGGERRLNVAVTRAKYNVKLVSSMHYTDIDMNRTKSDGARLLREYLDYAENGTDALVRTESRNPFERDDSDFEMEVCEFLRQKGFDVDVHVGCSALKVDLGVKYKGSDDYALAVECDGRTYQTMESTRDRDRLRQSVLEGMDWKYYRVWSIDWFRNKDTEKEKLLKAANAALSTPPERHVPSAVPTNYAEHECFEEEMEEEHFEFPGYVMADIEDIIRRKRDLKSVIVEILKVEGPVHEDWLLHRILPFFGTDKINVSVRRQYEAEMSRRLSVGIMRDGEFLRLQSVEIPELRVPISGCIPREIKQIFPGELANGMLTLLKQNVTAEKTAFFKSVAQLLGCSRVTESVTGYMEAALALLSGKVAETDGVLSLVG